MFNLRLGRICLSILQWYLILIVYQLQYVNYSNGETEVDKNLDIIVQNSSYTGINYHNKLKNVSIISAIPKIPNDTNASIYTNYHRRFCKNNVFKRRLEEILLESQRRNKISLDTLTQSIFDLTKRVNEVLFRPHFHGRCDYREFARTLISALQKMEGDVRSGFIKIDNDIERLLKFVRSPFFFNSHHHYEGICYNQHLQKTLRNLVKQLSTTIVTTFKNITETLNKVSYLIKNGPQNDTHLSDVKCNYEHVRNDLIESDLKLERDCGTAFDNTMRVAYDMTRIIGSELNYQEQKGIKLIENILAAVNDALESDEIRTDLSKTNESNNPPLPNSSEIFTNPYGCSRIYTDKTNLRLTPNDQAGIKEVVILALSELLGELLKDGIEYLANAIFNTPPISILPTTLNGTDLMMQAINEDSSEPNCTKYYIELQDEIHKVVNESVQFGKETIADIMKYYQNITDFLSKQNAGFHFLPPLLRISEWLSFIEMMYNEVSAIIDEYAPVLFTYIDTMEETGKNITSTFIKILNANCLARLLPVFQSNIGMLENTTQSKHTRITRSIGPLILKLAQALPLDLAHYGQDAKQRNATTLTSHRGTGPPLLPFQAGPTSTVYPNVNDTLAELINLLKLISDKLISKVRFVHNLSS